jgi:hypothetical protein
MQPPLSQPAGARARPRLASGRSAQTAETNRLIAVFEGERSDQVLRNLSYIDWYTPQVRF